MSDMTHMSGDGSPEARWTGPRRSRARRFKSRRQAGQATVEFVVLALAVVPLFLVVPLLGKFIDLLQTAELASRYVAFEGTVRNSSNGWKSDAQLATEVRRRFFSNTEASVKTNDAAGDFAAHRNPIWTRPDQQPMLASLLTGVAVQTRLSSQTALADTFYAGELGLPRLNLYDASVTVGPISLAGFAPLDRVQPRATRRTVLLADAWTARGPHQVRDAITDAPKLYPIAMAANDPLLPLVERLPELIFDPPLKLFAFDWDIVPCDRLEGGC